MEIKNWRYTLLTLDHPNYLITDAWSYSGHYTLHFRRKLDGKLYRANLYTSPKLLLKIEEVNGGPVINGVTLDAVREVHSDVLDSSYMGSPDKFFNYVAGLV